MAMNLEYLADNGVLREGIDSLPLSVEKVIYPLIFNHGIIALVEIG